MPAAKRMVDRSALQRSVDDGRSLMPNWGRCVAVLIHWLDTAGSGGGRNSILPPVWVQMRKARTPWRLVGIASVSPRRTNPDGAHPQLVPDVIAALNAAGRDAAGYIAGQHLRLPIGPSTARRIVANSALLEYIARMRRASEISFKTRVLLSLIRKVVRPNNFRRTPLVLAIEVRSRKIRTRRHRRRTPRLG